MLTFVSRPSILVKPLWLRYSSSRLTSTSSPCIRVIRFDCSDRILSEVNVDRFCSLQHAIPLPILDSLRVCGSCSSLAIAPPVRPTSPDSQSPIRNQPLSDIQVSLQSHSYPVPAQLQTCQSLLTPIKFPFFDLPNLVLNEVQHLDLLQRGQSRRMSDVVE